jgi:hypothetical protein
VYLTFNLTSLVRLDVRADAAGRLHILEANPKPDLAPPACGGAAVGATTSLIASGLPAMGWSYDDLIAYLLAERLWQLAERRPGSLKHFVRAGAAAADFLAALPPHVRAAARAAEPGEPWLAEEGGCDGGAGDGEEADVTVFADGAEGPGEGEPLKRLRSLLAAGRAAGSLTGSFAAVPRSGGSFASGEPLLRRLPGRGGGFVGGSFRHAPAASC